ncbi:DUF1467 family protein [Salipiger sp. 1_MG-2023]|uniref:DUF1467 family protein n=1 Tax=Salipiger sp. 1_MG-2023 TaxID=3062665 RepID=UPI0026E38436|nr:DUF1467 family protein [Salipiger sp. 1_MG-2023]MDO6584795.1 DUF1467 family protein [Salipiger sp. 1_MG-2023]
MDPVSGLVLFAVIWFMTFLSVIPFRLETQGDRGEVVHGTHASSPEVHNLRRKALITTGIAAVIWALAAWVILSGVISVRELDSWMFQRMSPRPEL